MENESEADDFRSDEDADETLENTLKATDQPIETMKNNSKPHTFHDANHGMDSAPIPSSNLDVSLTSSVGAGNTSLIATLKSLKTMQRKVASLDERAKATEMQMPEHGTMYGDSSDGEESDNQHGEIGDYATKSKQKTVPQMKRSSLENGVNSGSGFESGSSRKDEFSTEEDQEDGKDSDLGNLSK